MMMEQSPSVIRSGHGAERIGQTKANHLNRHIIADRTALDSIEATGHPGARVLETETDLVELGMDVIQAQRNGIRNPPGSPCTHGPAEGDLLIRFTEARDGLGG